MGQTGFKAKTRRREELNLIFSLRLRSLAFSRSVSIFCALTIGLR
jgi:hypothetical protein